MSEGNFWGHFWMGNTLIDSCKQQGDTQGTRFCNEINATVNWCSSMSFIHLLHQSPEESLCVLTVSSENCQGDQSTVSALFVLRYWWVCDPDALLPVQHSVCQPARQPSLWLSARLHQSGRILLHRYVCMHATTLLTHQILLHNGTRMSVKHSCISGWKNQFWNSFPVVEELEFFSWSVGNMFTGGHTVALPLTIHSRVVLQASLALYSGDSLHQVSVPSAVVWALHE